MRHRAPQAVGAQHKNVAVAQRRAPREIDDRIDQSAEAAEDFVAVRVLGHVRRADQALIDEILNLRVILGCADQAPLAKQIEARIAGVRPIRMARLDDDGDAGRARRFEHRELIGVGAERRVRAEHRLLKEFERIAQHRLGFLLEALDEQSHADLRGNLASRVTTHAVGDDQQQGVAPVRVGEPILIDLA